MQLKPGRPVSASWQQAWLDAYPHAVLALTREQVNAAIRNHLNPATMVLVEAGSLPPPAAPAPPTPATAPTPAAAP